MLSLCGGSLRKALAEIHGHFNPPTCVEWDILDLGDPNFPEKKLWSVAAKRMARYEKSANIDILVLSKSEQIPVRRYEKANRLPAKLAEVRFASLSPPRRTKFSIRHFGGSVNPVGTEQSVNFILH